MSAILDSDHKVIDCPHCKGKLEVEIERKPAKLKIEEREQPVSELEAMIEKALEKRAPKIKEEEKPKPEIKIESVSPFFQPGEFCADGKCGAPHKNKNYQQKPKKKCTTCGNYAPEKAQRCAWCKSSEKLDVEDRFEELDEDDLEDLKFEPMEVDHPHEH